ncbi:MAG: nuclear transport factor 2 family protein [Gemmatimonadaceae bacterium]|nr:nuclear transport factor 2 family protein [Gemmatimonadaceae bacterium]
MTPRPFLRSSVLVSMIATLAFTAICPALASAQAASKAADSVAVMRSLDVMLTAMRTRDAAGLGGIFHEHARMTLLRPAQDGSTRVVVLTGAQFVEAATNPQQPILDEPVRNAKVEIDGNLATVWAEYQVRIDGKVSHCGYDAFQLVKVSGTWKILNVSDTFRREGCGPMWPR